MREFDYSQTPNELMNEEIMNLVSAIHEYKGKQELYLEAKPDVFKAMLEIAKIQSIGASNRIEGIKTTDARMKALMNEKTEPMNRSEKEITGYRKVLSLIHESYDYMPPRKNLILQMHRDLYSYTEMSIGGVFKNSDNLIIETDAYGVDKIRFKPVPAFETADSIEILANSYMAAIEANKINPLLLIPRFILDFLCIHPFNDGNGRMSRLLTLLLLYRSGYIVGKYISIEMIIEKTKQTYYDVLQESSNNWYEGKSNYLPFVRYYLQILLSAYKDFSSRIELTQDKTLSKPERIKLMFDKTLNKLSKAQLMELCPDISKTTIELTLSKLVKEGYIIINGSGRSTAYIRKH